jgi:putative MATE family efflux protein
MSKIETSNNISAFGTESIKRLLVKLAPPVMLAQLIQALYNIVDSYFVGQFSVNGLTALSIVFPLQLLMTAIAIGTGVGSNILIAKFNGQNDKSRALSIEKVITFYSIISWLIYLGIVLISVVLYLPGVSDSLSVKNYALTYLMIVSFGGLPLFIESGLTKNLQAVGNMKLPMIAQCIGAVVNIIFDKILIFGFLWIPAMGIEGAAVATVLGQFCAACIVGKDGYKGLPNVKEILYYIKPVYKAGFPAIAMQSLCTVYIIGLNFILAKFSDEAVTVLGLYYKLQTFFFIPLFALQNCIVPILSYNNAAGFKKRCKEIILTSAVIGICSMSIGVILFEFFPGTLISIFTKSKSVLEIGKPAFRIIALSFIPAVIPLLITVYFQAVERTAESILMAVTRQILLFVPLGYILSLFGLRFVWFTFPLTEIITMLIGFIMIKRNKN